MKNNKKWFSLIMAMWLVLVFTLTALFILSYMIPFSRTVNWVENSSKSYYEANNWIEEALRVQSQATLWSSETALWSIPIATRKWSVYGIQWKGNILPPAWEGTSEFNTDWNRVAEWMPIQLEIWRKFSGMTDTELSGMVFYIKVPNLDRDDSTQEKILWDHAYMVINWQLTSPAETLNSKDSQIFANDICISNASNLSACTIRFTDTWFKDGKTLAWDEITFQQFYNNHCEDPNSACTLKMSVVNKVTTNDGKSMPYLEWKAIFPKSVPLRYTTLEAVWKSHEYQKSLKAKVQQQTVIEAFDFAVFQ